MGRLAWAALAGAVLGLLLAPLTVSWGNSLDRGTPLVSREAKRSGAHLLLQWNFTPRPARAAEYARALRMNVLNEHFAAIHLFQSSYGDDYHHPEPQSPELCWINPFVHGGPTSSLLQEGPRTPLEVAAWDAAVRGDSAAFRSAVRQSVCSAAPYTETDLDPSCALAFDAKVQVHFVDFIGRLSARSALEYASRQLTNEVCILANLDIVFDETLGLVLNSTVADLSPTLSYFLSRYEYPGSGSHLPSQCGSEFVGSHDAIVFLSPLPAALLPRTAMRLGCWGFENRLMHEFEQMGMRIRNPCKDVHTWHVHETQYKAGWMPLVNHHGKSSVAFPDHMATQPTQPLRRDVRRADEDRGKPLTGASLAIRGQHSGKCLMASNGTLQHAWCREEKEEQQWMVIPAPLGNVRIRSRKLLHDIAAENDQVKLVDVAGGVNVLWTMRPVDANRHTYMFINAATGLCLASSYQGSLGTASPSSQNMDSCSWFVERLYSSSN